MVFSDEVVAEPSDNVQPRTKALHEGENRFARSGDWRVGFIGSHLVDSLMRDGYIVTVLDNFDRFYGRVLKERNVEVHRANPWWRLVEGDLRDLGGMRHQPAGPVSSIVHLAAKAGVRPSIEDPLGYQDVNVRGTQHLLEFAREQGVPHFVFASSSSVYGVNPRAPWSEEDHVLRPISPYASTKVSGELLGHVYSPRTPALRRRAGLTHLCPAKA